MHPHYKKKCVTGLSTGLTLVIGGFGLAYVDILPRGIVVLLIFVGIPIYLWGCASLARAKGYSLTILVTAFLGLLFPMVVLLVLPDKQRHYRRRP